jgi:ABC-type lipoprotein release transport system permease subunit
MQGSPVNSKQFRFALDSLRRRGGKNLAVWAVFTLIIALLASVLLLSGTIKKELDLTLDSLPDITVQQLAGGRQTLLQSDMAYTIAALAGVSQARERVWGYYYFQNAGVNFTVVGLDFFLPPYQESLRRAVEDFDITAHINEDFMIVGEGVKKTLRASYYRDYFNFITSSGEIKKVHLSGSFKGATALETNDVILMPVALAREVLEIEEPMATDIVVFVPNPVEIPTVARKIRELYPATRVIAKEDIRSSYQNIFDYKSGVFLALFVTVFFAFFILVYEKASGLGVAERREIGILKAVGWRIEDVVRLKLTESTLLALSAFITGFLLALFYVFILGAPLLLDLFAGYSVLKPETALLVYVDFYTIGLIFIATVPLYVAAVIIPSWQAAVIDADEVMR